MSKWLFSNESAKGFWISRLKDDLMFKSLTKSHMRYDQ